MAKMMVPPKSPRVIGQTREASPNLKVWRVTVCRISLKKHTVISTKIQQLCCLASELLKSNLIGNLKSCRKCKVFQLLFKAPWMSVEWVWVLLWPRFMDGQSGCSYHIENTSIDYTLPCCLTCLLVHQSSLPEKIESYMLFAVIFKSTCRHKSGDWKSK